VEIRLASLGAGAAAANGTVVVIDVFRAFTTAAIALARGARHIVMVDSIERALDLRARGLADCCIGERDSVKPPDFDFGNSPAEIARADLAGRVLVQTTTNGTAGINAALGAERIYAGAFVNAGATVAAIRRRAPSLVTFVAIGRRGGAVRADEDELCALYLRARLEGRHPDPAAIRALLKTMPRPPDPRLVAAGAYDPRDRDIAADIDRVPFALAVRRHDGLLIAEAELPD
jgi:2-phosphosulfolactate phosphatase